jgi:hypothetical protein
VYLVRDSSPYYFGPAFPPYKGLIRLFQPVFTKSIYNATIKPKMRISTLNASGYIHNQSSARPLCRHVPLYTPHIRRLRVRDQTAHWTPNLYCDLYPRCGIFPKRWGIGPAAFSRNSIHRARSASTLEMEGIQKPQGSVVIIGAGTQGRRLAHMVSTDIQDHEPLSWF